ncbi:MAG TPA: HEAT repeat domain-containing protein [Holophagaceae bacterium]|nr:HEAT repeat domain-containing protein [Holophagaceae bacterium]
MPGGADIGLPARLAGLPLLELLGWLALALFLVLGFLLAMALAVQVRSDRIRARRLACHARWEGEMAAYLYLGRDADTFQQLDARDRALFRHFLQRALLSIGGEDANRIRELASRLDLHDDLARRLAALGAASRARAALEVGLFQRWEHLDRVEALLKDPAPSVAFAAARTLARSGDLSHAAPVLAWVLGQEKVQQERLLRVLMGFGPGLLPWMEARLGAPPQPREGWRLYGLLVATFRDLASGPRMRELLASGDLELTATALKALRALGDPSAYGAVAPFATHPEWVLRAQTALGLGTLGGLQALPALQQLMEDRVFEVRRNAAQSIAELGSAGEEVLRWIALGQEADPFARDLARERVQWLEAAP